MSTALTYPVVLEPDDNGTVLATLPDFPGATFGDTREDALAHAQDLLITVVESYMTKRRPLPVPSDGGDARLALPPSAALKVAVYNAMVAGGVKKVDLAARMGQSKQQVDRLLQLKHRSRSDQIDEAFAAMGLTLAGIEVTTPSPARRTLAARRRPAVRRKRVHA